MFKILQAGLILFILNIGIQQDSYASSCANFSFLRAAELYDNWPVPPGQITDLSEPQYLREQRNNLLIVRGLVDSHNTLSVPDNASIPAVLLTPGVLTRSINFRVDEILRSGSRSTRIPSVGEIIELRGTSCAAIFLYAVGSEWVMAIANELSESTNIENSVFNVYFLSCCFGPPALQIENNEVSGSITKTLSIHDEPQIMPLATFRAAQAAYHEGFSNAEYTCGNFPGSCGFPPRASFDPGTNVLDIPWVGIYNMFSENYRLVLQYRQALSEAPVFSVNEFQELDSNLHPIHSQ
ncbi:MAG: hypothetical protein AAF512_16975 [Pseudomonadota bacterium]